MGTKLKELVVPKPLELQDLQGKVLFVDALNVLYQFLTSIRQRDGTPLKTSSGALTSHLVGLFNRTTKLMLSGIRLAFVFDGKPPELKHYEQQRRAVLKERAEEKYKEAKQAEDIEAMRKFAARSSRLTADMIADSRELLTALGVPVIQAPGEGEAQAAHMVAAGLGYGVVSEDYDTLLFGVPRLIKGLSISHKRKERDVLNYTKTEIELIELEELLNTLKLNQDQLIALGMLIGTDFNPGGIRGIGPKKALRLVQAHGTNFRQLFREVEWAEQFNYPWKQVFNIFKQVRHTDEFELKWGRPDEVRIKELLIGRFEFSEANVERRLKALETHLGTAKQQSLGDFF